MVPPVIFHHLIDTIIVGYVERRVLSSRVEVPGVCERRSSDTTVRQQ